MPTCPDCGQDGLLACKLPAGEKNHGLMRPGLIRHYSISSDWRDADHYVVTVARAAGSRGGSIAMHHDVRVGTTLGVRGPRNHFPLAPEAECFRFIAGGIGITPIMSMVRWCTANNKSWSLLYCARSKNRAAFYD